MQALLKAGSRPHATLHSFRHTFNSTLRDLGMSIEDRQVLLAHASSETNKIYTHPNFNLASDYVNKDELLNNFYNIKKYERKKLIKTYFEKPYGRKPADEKEDSKLL